MRDSGANVPFAAGFVIVAAVVSLSALSLLNENFLYPLAAVIVLSPPVWTYTCARVSGVKGAFYWGLLALFANVVGMIFYYLNNAGPSRRAGITCVECGVPMEENWNYCPFCSASLKK